jgi:hypothetical protein
MAGYYRTHIEGMPIAVEMSICSRHKNFESAIDEGKVRERLQRELSKRPGNDIAISELFVTRVFPRKTGGLTIQYELYPESPGRWGRKKLIFCGHLLGAGEKPPAYLKDSPERCIFLADIDLVVPLFPYDPGLPALDILTRTENESPISEKLGRLLRQEAKITGFEILGYRLEKRSVIRYEVRKQDRSPDSMNIVVKAYRRSGFSRSLKVIKALEDKGFNGDSAEGFAIPGLLGSDSELGAIYMENAPGISLHSLFEKDIFIKACSAAGGILCRLHKLDADDLNNHTKLDELGNLRKLLELIYSMYPEFKEFFDQEYKKLAESAGDDFPDNVFAHRDFFDKQVLFSENRTTLLDCDNAASADPALDAGNFIAHLSLRKLQHPDCARNLQGGIDAFIKSYGKFDESFLVRTVWWIRASRLRLAALYLLRPRWREIVHMFLNRPMDFLGQRVPGGINGK